MIYSELDEKFYYCFENLLNRAMSTQTELGRFVKDQLMKIYYLKVAPKFLYFSKKHDICTFKIVQW